MQIIYIINFFFRYYCTAENDLGSSTTNLSVGVNLSPKLPRHDDLRSCCKNEGVEDDSCLEICTFSLDLDLLAFEVWMFIFIIISIKANYNHIALFISKQYLILYC